MPHKILIFINFLSIINTEACNFLTNKNAVSSYERAQSVKCKELIKDLACKFEEQNKLYQDLNNLASKNINYELNLKSKCKKSFNLENSSKFLTGCTKFLSLFLKELDTLNNTEIDAKVKILKYVNYQNIDDVEICVKVCLTKNAYRYAAYNKKNKECICFKNATQNFLHVVKSSENCDFEDDQTFMVYHTGLLDSKPLNQSFIKRKYSDIMKDFFNLKSQKKLPRIVFFLTLNGRSKRQIFRLIKSIYDDLHFYYIHIDQRMRFLRREIKHFILKINKKNFYLPNWSYPGIWGGSSLLKIHLKAMKEIVLMKENGGWDWDFVLNLSESDFPIKSVQELTLFLSQHRDKNFLKFFKKSFERFSMNQGFEVAFLQCENRMWHLGEKKMPIGIQFTGGSDWFCLNSKFVDYIIKSKEIYMDNLKIFFNHSILPSESFFHTVLQNSPFCDDTYINSHLRYVNWKRDRGCNCQHKAVVDWCGCSPNYLTHKYDLTTLKIHENQPSFFARKFDPLNNLKMINTIDQSIYGVYHTSLKSLNSYWENVYDVRDAEVKNELYEVFSNISFENIEEKLIASEFLEYQSFDINQTLQKVEAFFQADSFVGYVLNFRIQSQNHINLEYESFFKTRNSKNIVKIYDLIDKENQTLVALRETILQSLTVFRVSTDFDQKENRLQNYAGVMDVNSNPILHMEFDPLSSPIEFYVTWYDSNEIKIKEIKVNLNITEKSKLILNSLQKMENFIKLNSSGIWRIDISLSGTLNSRILSIKFLILPEKILDKKISIPLVDNFWELNSICIHKLEKLGSLNSILYKNLFNDCEKDSFWSSYYPDPKSDLDDSLGINLDYRIL